MIVGTYTSEKLTIRRLKLELTKKLKVSIELDYRTF